MFWCGFAHKSHRLSALGKVSQQHPLLLSSWRGDFPSAVPLSCNAVGTENSPSVLVVALSLALQFELKRLRPPSVRSASDTKHQCYLSVFILFLNRKKKHRKRLTASQ